MSRPTQRTLSHEAVKRLLVDSGEWFSCDDCFTHLDEYVERLVNGGSGGLPGMRGHLRGCPACAEEAATLAVLVAEEAGRDPSHALAQLGV